MQTRQKKMIEQIGARIRAERNRLGLSLEALAKKAGISKMTLQRIETGQSSPSIITLTEISFHLKQPIETLLKESGPKVLVLKKEDQAPLFHADSGIRMLAAKGLIDERISITYTEMETGDEIEPHQNQGFEWAFFIEGSAVVGVGDTEYPVKKGDAIFYDAHFPHSIKVEENLKYVGLFLSDD